MKLIMASQATSPSTVATPWPRPNLLPEALHRDLEAKLVARRDDVLEAALVDRGEEPEAIAEAGLLGHEDPHGLGQRLDLEDAGHDRLAGEVARRRTTRWP